MRMRTIGITFAITSFLYGCGTIAQTPAPTPSTIVSIKTAGTESGHILVDGEFSGFTPATLRIAEPSSKVVIEFGAWGYETTYALDLGWAEGVPSVIDANVSFASDGCLGRDESDKAKARDWARGFKSNRLIPKDLDLPGYTRITRGCPFSPWFGEARFYDLTINSDPPGAMVAIEGEVAGITPLHLKLKHEFARNRMNKLRVAASIDGYVTEAQTFVARESKTVTNLHFVLHPAR